MGILIVKFLGAIAIILLIGGMGAVLAIYFKKKADQREALRNGWAIKGDLSRSQERQIIAENENANELFRSLIAPPSGLEQIGEATLLSGRHREAIDTWLATHKVTSTKKGIGR